MTFIDFDDFVEKHNIQPDEMGAAFAAWLGGTGWDGTFEKVTCAHALKTVDYDGNPVEKPYSSIFCPECGARIEPPGPTKPFHLRPDQR